MDHADNNADRGGDVADLAEIRRAADLLQAEEHQEHDGGDGELRHDKTEDVCEWCEVNRSGLDECGNGEERHGCEIGVGRKFSRGRPFGPGHGAVIFPRPRKIGMSSAAKIQNVPPPLKSALREKMMITAPARPTAIPANPNRFGGRTRNITDNSAVTTGESANMIAARPLPIFGITEKVRKFGTT